MIDFPAIAAAALSAADTLVPEWLPAGKKSGHEWLCGDLHGNRGESTSINLRTGAWADFAGDAKGGDLISLYAAIKGCSQVDAARDLGERFGIRETPAEKPKSKAQKWTQVIPAPPQATRPTMRHFSCGEPVGRWEYQDSDGRTIGWIGRFTKSDGGKEVMPLTWGRSLETGEEKWCWLSFPKPRPLYGLPLLRNDPNARVVIVEGEKCADALRARGLLVVTWPGGGKAVQHANWTPLSGRKVTFWPDKDRQKYTDKDTKDAKLIGKEKPWEKQPGYRAMMDAAQILHALGCEVRLIDPPADVSDGWDCADAIEEGWTNEQIGELFKSAMVYTPPAPPPPAAPKPPPPTSDWPFTCLGYDHGTYYYLSHATGQIVDLSARQHGKYELLQLAELKWWAGMFPGQGEESGPSWLCAAASLMEKSHDKGIFDITLIRGRGAWIDDGRVVYHAGTRLFVDGVPTNIERFPTRYIYQRSKEIAYDNIEPATAKEAGKLLTMLRGTNLRDALDPVLLAGWLVCAPICGALSWRPGIWISGKAGSGKTWLVDKIIQNVLGEGSLQTMGTGTSEPGLRQSLKHDAFPIVIDEAETETKADFDRIQAILRLQRQASHESKARIIKGSAGGTAMDFCIRSMFLWASIGVSATQRADLSRNVLMELIPGKHAHNPDQWADLQEFQVQTAGNPKWCAAFRARSLKLAPVISRGASILAAACARHLGTQRDGDQIGALLAGAWALTSDNEITPAQAEEWCSRLDWSVHTPNETDMDEAKCLAHLSGAIIEHEENDRRTRRAIGELLEQALSRRASGYDRNAVRASLERHGVAVKKDGVHISDSHQELKRIFNDTPFAGKWRDQLRRIEGAAQIAGSRFNASTHRCVRLPFDLFQGGE